MKLFPRKPAMAALPVSSSGSIPVLSFRTQFLLGTVISLVLLSSCFIANSLLPIAAILGVALFGVMLRNPVYSIIGFMAISVAITLRPNADSSGGAPTSLDLIFGVCLAVIIGYWIIKIRLLEWQSLTEFAIQLCLIIFFAWAIAVTIGGIIFNNNSASTALREILNLLPLLIMPLLYLRFITPDSKEENFIFIMVLASGFAVTFGNILMVRGNIAKAYYLYQTGRGTIDPNLTAFVIVLMVSYLMSEERLIQSKIGIVFILVESVGLMVSLSRNSYVDTFVSSVIVLWLGTREERKRGMSRVLSTTVIASIFLTFVIKSYHILSLLFKEYFARFLSTQHLGHDLALRERFAEWSSEWLAIKQSPVVGHGFGAAFRFFDLGDGVHVWQSFSHNSYLYIIFKTGIIGATLFFVPFFTFLYKGFKLSRNPSLSKRSRIIARGCFGCYIVLLFSAYLGPVFDSKTDLMWVGLIWGYLLAVEKQIRNSKTVSQQHSLT